MQTEGVRGGFRFHVPHHPPAHRGPGRAEGAEPRTVRANVTRIDSADISARSIARSEDSGIPLGDDVRRGIDGAHGHARDGAEHRAARVVRRVDHLLERALSREGLSESQRSALTELATQFRDSARAARGAYQESGDASLFRASVLDAFRSFRQGLRDVLHPGRDEGAPSGVAVDATSAGDVTSAPGPVSL